MNMSKSHAHHLLLQLIKKSGQQRHYEALNTLYPIEQVDTFTVENLPEDFYFQDIHYVKQLNDEYSCTTKTNFSVMVDLDIILSTVNRHPEDVLIFNNNGEFVPVMERSLTK